MPLSKATTGQLHRQEAPNTAALKSDTIQELPAGRKPSFVRSQDMDANLAAENSAKTQNNTHENQEASRIFKPEEYPALSTQDPPSTMSLTAKVADIAISIVAPAQKSSCFVSLLKAQGSQAISEPEKKPWTPQLTSRTQKA
jgi:hypothetical protein